MATKAAPPERLPSEPESGQTTIGRRHVGAKAVGVGDVSAGDTELAALAGDGGRELHAEVTTMIATARTARRISKYNDGVAWPLPPAATDG